MNDPITTFGFVSTPQLAVLILMPLETILVLGAIVFIAIPLCGTLIGLIGWAGKKYFDFFFKSPGKLKIKFLKMEVDLQGAGIVFLFLAIVIVLAVLYAFLRMVPGKS